MKQNIPPSENGRIFYPVISAFICAAAFIFYMYSDNAIVPIFMAAYAAFNYVYGMMYTITTSVKDIHRSYLGITTWSVCLDEVYAEVGRSEVFGSIPAIKFYSRTSGKMVGSIPFQSHRESDIDNIITDLRTYGVLRE